MHPDRLSDDLTDLEARVEGTVRVLEDHLDAPPHSPEHLAPKFAQLAPIKDDGTCRRLFQLEDAATGSGLSTTGFAHEAERLAPANLEIDAVHRFHMRDDPAHYRPFGDREVHP